MKHLCEIAALCTLTAAMPFPERSSFPALSRRSHSVSQYSTYMKRQRHSNPHPRLLHRRQTIKSQNIIDDEQVRFLIPITLGSQTLDAEFDTGSSDVWLAESGFTCYSSYSQGSFTTPVDSSTCNFPNTYTPDSSFSPYEGVTFTDCYGSSDAGRCVAGQYGSVDVTIAGLTVPGQSVGSGSMISYKADGNGEQSGIIGASLDPTPGSSSSGTYYSLFENLFVNDQFTPSLPPEFALAISRDESQNGFGGSLVIGGIPETTDSRINATESYFTASFDLANPSGGTYTFYGIQLDSLYADGSYYDQGVQILIDSGNSNLVLPSDFANAYNSLWGVNSDGLVDCSAVPAGLWIGVGGGFLYINPIDLIVPNGDGSCRSAVLPASAGDPYWLGDPFLKNVIALFDWGNQAMDFYSRPYYDS